MSKKPAAATPSHPPLGSFIDGNTLELVEVLGVGGYGVVYRAVEAYAPTPRSFAVKCLLSAHGQSASRRQLHLREIALHQIASAHPAVVTLHRIVEDMNYTFIIMDFAPDDDLFTQILHKTRYLGNDALIRHVFLQLLDAVQYCHSLGIYHRDLKPENVLCFDRGYRIAITDFGLATTDKFSREYRTGSVYHMSPECQAGDSERPTPYSPMHNDIWSLGIILLNLVTGRNPWKSAMPDDATYQAYRRDPAQFLPSVLPISDELNKVLVRVLEANWQARISLPELRACIQNINSFYSASVIFEGSLARCPWEAGLDLGNGTHHTKQAQPQPAPAPPPAPAAAPEKRPVPNVPENVEPYCVFSMSEAVSEYKSEESGDDDTFFESAAEQEIDMYDEMDSTPYETNSARSSYTSESSSPSTPSSCHDFNARYYEGTYPSSYGAAPSEVQTEDDNRFASSVFLATPVAEANPFFYHPDNSYMDGYRTQKRYSSPNTSVYSVAEESGYDVQSPTSTEFPPHSPNFHVWPEAGSSQSRPIDIHGGAGGAGGVAHGHGHGHGHGRGGSGSGAAVGAGAGAGTGGRAAHHRDAAKPKAHNIFNPLRFFPRSAGSSWLNQKASSGVRYTPGPPPPGGGHMRMRAASPPTVPLMGWNENYYPPHQLPNAHGYTHRGRASKYRPG